MNILTIDNQFVNSAITANADSKGVVTTLENLGRNLRLAEVASVDLPLDAIAKFSLNDGSVKNVRLATIFAKWATLPTSGLTASDFFSKSAVGSPFKGFTIPELATVAASSGTIGEIVSKLETPEQHLYSAIRSTVRSEIERLQNMLSAINDDYLDCVVSDIANNADFALKFADLTVDVSTVRSAINTAKLQDKLNAIRDCFAIGKTVVVCELSADCKTVEIQLTNWLHSQYESVALDAITKLGHKAVFTADKSGILTKLASQVATVTL